MRNLIPLLVLVGFGARLSAIDLKENRLPNQLVAWFTAIQLATLIALSLDGVNELKVALLVAVGTTAIYLILFILSRGALGMGDVKFAFPLGLTVGWYDPEFWLMAIFSSFLCAGVVALIGIAAKLITRNSPIAFGPYMFLGSLFVIAFSVLSHR
jgi:leader peptidase (prepilin peptidase)/N-methyltransferase